mgnify:CR=1 FL=1
MRIRITLLATALTFAVGSVPASAAQQDAPLMWQSNGDTSFEGMGRRLYALDDFNGDSRTDIISVNPNGSSNLMTQNGVIRAISGTDGSHLWRIDGNYDFEQLGLTFPTIDDINGDGIRDLFALTSMGSTNGFLRNGFCRAISGADGSMMWQVFGMSDNEQFIFTSNLKYQTMLDSVICRGVPTLLQYVTNTELEACMMTWQFFENIFHISIIT